MLTLQNKLYESLLDDEEVLVSNETTMNDLIEQWAAKFGIAITPTLSKINPGIKIDKSGDILSKYLRPNKSMNYKLSELFDPVFTYKKLDVVDLGCGTTCSCDDLMDVSTYDYFPSCIQTLKLGFFRKTDAENIDFNKLSIIKNLQNLHIRISNSGLPVFNIKKLPKMHLNDIRIDFGAGILNLESISGLNCERFMVENFTNNNMDRIIKVTKGSGLAPEFVYVYRTNTYLMLDKFFEKNKVKDLIIVTGLKVGYKIVKVDTRYLFKKVQI